MADIGTIIFDGPVSTKGYPLNKMCFTFNDQPARDEFVADEKAYCKKFGLSDKQTEAILGRDVLTLLAEGGNAYYLAKLVSAILGLDMQDLGALETGMTKDQFKQRLLDADLGLGDYHG